jgi:hypothetical protein
LIGVYGKKIHVDSPKVNEPQKKHCWGHIIDRIEKEKVQIMII